jgi:murein DD-endopeptidase MepM/ murein hydrolase activator NlpD
MSEDKEKKGELLKRLKLRYRLVVMNDDTFEEKISLSLTPLKLFITLGTIIILMIILVTSVIAFTPLREYIPGYADVSIWRKLISISRKSDSLEQEIAAKNLYLESLNKVLSGEIGADELDYSKPDTAVKFDNLKISASENEVKLRDQVESSIDIYSIDRRTSASKPSENSYFFFTPIKGIVSNSFNEQEKHYGVDILGRENEPIKATMDGTVILATWTSETGHTITIQHNNQYISVYKHNSILLKKVGSSVKAGEPIAIIGNSGEHTTGPHLHFELWYNGRAIDPQDYISF